ncbi:MAG: phage/plasmid primase, P4 family [Allorhizobium sp.]
MPEDVIRFLRLFAEHDRNHSAADALKGVPDPVFRIMVEAEEQRRGYQTALPRRRDASAGADIPIEVVVVKASGSGRRGKGSPDAETLTFCAGLDHSDTDNAKRLLAYADDEIVVVEQSGAQKPRLAVWDGKRWDLHQGKELATLRAQKVGDFIKVEARYIKPNGDWQKAWDLAETIIQIDEDERTKEQKEAIKLAARYRSLFEKRVKRHRDWGESSKNAAKIAAMVQMAAPHVSRPPGEFNAHPLRFACQNATLTFSRIEGADGNCQSIRLEVLEGHDPGHLITHLAAARYDRRAQCPRWMEFLERVQPDPKVRRLIQVGSGLGLVAEKVQKLFFHYGSGANGKSVYMETVTRLLGDMAVTLPATSLIGESGPGGGAQADIARLYGCRFLRVKELPEGENLKENLVKELTGGEMITARDLFSGYMDFEPVFVAMMSGNGYPRINGIDEGIWRRMAVVHWGVRIPEEERIEFDELLRIFEEEFSGILNWLIEGVAIYLKEGLVIPDAVRSATQEYRDSQDPTASFFARCVVEKEGGEVSALDFYKAYEKFAEAEHFKPISNNAFGRIIKNKVVREKRRDRSVYVNIALVTDIASSDDVAAYGDDDAFPLEGY